MLYYAFLIFVYTHIIGCIMWLSFKTNERWIPAVDFGSVDTKIHLDYRYRTFDDGSPPVVLPSLLIPRKKHSCGSYVQDGKEVKQFGKLLEFSNQNAGEGRIHQ